MRPRSPSEAAGRAICRIQGRLGDAETGQLSLAPNSEAAGGLSAPMADGGELSLTREKA